MANQKNKLKGIFNWTFFSIVVVAVILVNIVASFVNFRADATNENLEVTFSEEDKAIFIQVYQPFTGHGTKIGHYYRHMLQAVSYVDGQDSKFLSDQQKDERKNKCE